MYSSPVVCTRLLTSRHSYVLVSCTIPTRMYWYPVVCTRLHSSPHSSVVLDPTILVACCKYYDLTPFVYENRTELLNKFHVPIFMKLSASLEGLSFNIRHVFERDVY